MIRYRLIIPLKRSVHSPKYAARGTGVGLAWAFTPLIGIQMSLIFLTWAVCKKLKWRFSLPLALAWTWVTNVFNLAPIYYVFYVTGQIMRGRWGNISGYENLRKMISKTFLSDLTMAERSALIFELLFKDWGFSMLIGSLPWAFIFGVGGYYASLRFILKHRAMRAAKMRAKEKKKKGKKWNNWKI